MNARAHTVRVVPGLEEATRQWGRDHRAGRHRATRDHFDEDMELSDLFGPTSNHSPVPVRETESLVLPAAEVLHALVERHGLKAVIATLRALCDSHVSSGDDVGMELGAMLEDEEKSDSWREAANALEALATSGKVDVR